MVSHLFRRAELLEEEHSDSLATHVTIRSLGKSFAASVFAEHSRFTETEVQVRRHDSVDAPDDSHIAGSVFHGFYRSVNGDQRAGTRGFDGLTRAVEVKQVAHAVGADGGRHPGGRETFTRPRD